MCARARGGERGPRDEGLCQSAADTFAESRVGLTLERQVWPWPCEMVKDLAGSAQVLVDDRGAQELHLQTLGRHPASAVLINLCCSVD